MKKTIIACMLAAFALLFTLQSLEARQGKKSDTLFQVSPVSILVDSRLDGWMRLSEVRTHGDFGVGTFHAVDGEMILLDGVFYKAKGDGAVETVPSYQKTPLAFVTKFEADHVEILTKNYTYTQLQTYVKSLFPSHGIIYAVKITGNLKNVGARGIDPIPSPYPHWTEIFSHYQRFFNYPGPFRGTLVGLWGPPYFAAADPTNPLNVINLPGFHFHFISDDREKGGHVLETEVLKGAKLEINYLYSYHVVCPERNDRL